MAIPDQIAKTGRQKTRAAAETQEREVQFIKLGGGRS
jgi:hypothetical protein